MTSKPIAIAVVGLGKIARDQHLPAIAGNPRLRLAATVDRQPAGLHVPHFETLDALFAAGVAVDAVAICTPPQVRAALARQAIAAGKPVLLEKPPAATPEDVAALRQQADAAGVALFAAWHSRFAAMVAQARAWVAGRTITGGRMTWREDHEKWHPGQHWLWQPGGMGVFDPGINGLSILTALLPGPARVRDAVLEIPESAATPIAARFGLDIGAVPIAVDLDFREQGDERWEIALECSRGGRLLLARGGAAIAIDGEPLRLAADAEYPRLYAHFLSLIDAGASDVDATPLQIVADLCAQETAASR